MSIERGDRVRLTPRMITALEKQHLRRRTNDWRNRTGTVARVNSTSATILWDGNKSLDQWPIAAVEKIDERVQT